MNKEYPIVWVNLQIDVGFLVRGKMLSMIDIYTKYLLIIYLVEY